MLVMELTYKQIQDLLYISGMTGGKVVEVKIEQRGRSGIDRIYAYCGERCWWLPKQGKMNEVVAHT